MIPFWLHHPIDFRSKSKRLLSHVLVLCEFGIEFAAWMETGRRRSPVRMPWQNLFLLGFDAFRGREILAVKLLRVRSVDLHDQFIDSDTTIGLASGNLVRSKLVGVIVIVW
jgi:hypothetical protein